MVVTKLEDLEGNQGGTVEPPVVDTVDTVDSPGAMQDMANQV